MALNFPDSPTLNQVYTDSTSGFSYQWNGTVWISFSPSTTNNISELDDISASFNGSTTIFGLTVNGIAVSPASTNQLLISVGGVMQNPTNDYYISGSNIIFTTAPTSGLTFFGILLGTAVPISYANDGNVYNRQTYAVTGVQTSFTFTTGYTVGYLDVFRNGSRLISGDDFTATNGTTFSLTSAAQNGDDVEAIGYKVSSIVLTEGNLTNLLVNQNAQVLGITTLGANVAAGQTALTVQGNARVTGILTVGSSSITLNGSTDQINVGSGLTLSSSGILAGVITATSFVGNGSGLTGAGSTVADDTTTNATFYPVITQQTSGIITASKVSTTKLSFNPSTGTVTATSFAGNVTGNATGLSGTPNIVVGVATATTLTAGNVTISSGIVTATSGVTTYYGDGSKLSGISASGTLLRAPQVLTSGTSYTTPAGCTKIYVECVGGGGAGGGVSGNGEEGGGGGGSGGYCAKYFTVTPSTSYTYAIGSGGSGFNNSSGGTGGSTTFTVSGTTITASGGSGGGTQAGFNLAGGSGGSASNGDLNVTGGGGQSGWVSQRVGGNGGSSFFGGSGRGVGYNAAPSSGEAGSSGGGGGGAGSYNTGGTQRAGGAGGNGLIRIWEYS